MESRLIDLEIRYAHLERQVAEMSQVVFEQQRTIEALRKQLLDLSGRIGELRDPPPDDRPPHY